MSIKNMFESILSDDGEETEPATGSVTDDGMTDGGGLMAEEGDDEFDDLGGLDDDGDGFGDDEFGDMDDAGADTDELEHRLDELENEVGSLSSTVNTVRTENEQISDTVQDVEENVRKLLDIYEMVTRGVNPFADDIEAGMGGGMGDGGSFGLFEDDGDDGGGEDIDEGIAEADAEGFFDEDLVEDPAEDEPEPGGGSVDDMFPEADEAEADEPDATFDEDFEDDPDEDDDDEAGGKSFQELKDEYDDGDADWDTNEESTDDADEAGGDDDDAAGADAGDAAGADAGTAEMEPTEAPTDDEGADLADDELFDEVVEDDGLGETGGEAEHSSSDTATTNEESGTQASTGQSPAAAGGDDGKPYLGSLSGSVATDVIVVEWLEYLTDVAGYRGTARAIDYYEDIEWISPDVADQLQEYLRGFDAVDGGEEGLSIDDHTTSLEYISQLDGGGGASVALSKLAGGGGRGLQR